MNLGFITNVVPCDESGINEIIRSYKNGEIIGFPTDTVYGIGCDPFKKDSITKIFELKKRDGEKRFPILGISKEELKKIVEFNSDAEKISKKFWPGQVTLLLPIRKEVSEKIENDLGDSLMTKLIWKPQNFVEASNELVQTASKLMEALENDEDVQSVHSNLVFS